LGSSNIHFKDKILLTLGTPEKHVSKNSLLAQDDNSKFGKILEIDKENLIRKINDNTKNLELNIFSKGHRVPQGLTLMNDNIFSVEHGPKGGDELNLIFKGKNYGWPKFSYGTNYMKENGGDGQSYPVNHEKNGYEEPLFAFVPSVGISSLNNCPSILKKYYKKPCLIALSLYGNNLRKGYSLIIFLLNESLDKVNSIEKISFNNIILRHFVTDKRNVLYEDKDGNIYVSSDKKGIYKITFKNFR
jgi:glucose/arabinose dehydrogenase